MDLVPARLEAGDPAAEVSVELLEVFVGEPLHQCIGDAPGKVAAAAEPAHVGDHSAERVAPLLLHQETEQHPAHRVHLVELELADLLIRRGARTAADLEELWRRIVFFACVSNTDDHLRNHGFLLTPTGWTLSPAYDMNPDPYGEGLSLNISESDNAQDLQLVLDVASAYRVKAQHAKRIVGEVVAAVGRWRRVADNLGLSSDAHDRMRRAFRVADNAL